MSQSKDTNVSAWIRLRSFADSKCKVIQLSIERRSFEHKLETIVRAALAHHSSGLSAGEQEYKLLSEQAKNLCLGFASRWSIDPNLLEAQIPAIGKLKSLADPPPKIKPATLVSLGVVGTIALFILLGVLAKLTSIGFHLIGGH